MGNTLNSLKMKISSSSAVASPGQVWASPSQSGLVLTFCRRCLECRLSARTADAAATTYRQIRICLSLSLSLCVCVCVRVLMFAAVEMGLRFCRRICDKSLCTSESIKKEDRGEKVYKLKF